MTTLERLEAAATRVGGADAPQRLQQKIEEANYPISLHALADLLVARVDTSHAPDAVLDAVVKVLLRPNIPLMVPDAILGMAGIAMAELKMRHEAQAVLDSLEHERQQGRGLTESSAFTASIAKRTFELDQALEAAARAFGMDDLLTCAADPARGPARLRALQVLAGLARDRRTPLPPDHARRLGLILRAAYTSDAPGIGADFHETWARCDRAGAEAGVRRRFDTTGRYDERLLHYLDQAARDAAEKTEWRALVHHLVTTLLQRGGKIDLNLQAIWRREMSAAMEDFFAGLDVAALPEPSRHFVVTMLEARSSDQARSMLAAVAGSGGFVAERARTALARGSGPEREAREERDAKAWRETRSADSLKRLYFEHIQYVPEDAPFDRWMTLLGADGVREGYGFRPRDAEYPYLYVEVDPEGRLKGIRFKE